MSKGTLAGMTLGPRDFLTGRLLMVAFLLILLSRDVANMFGAPPTELRLAGSVLVTIAVVIVGYRPIRGIEMALQAGAIRMAGPV